MPASTGSPPSLCSHSPPSHNRRMIGRIVADLLFLRGTSLLRAGRPSRAARYLSLAARIAASNHAYYAAAALAARGAGDLDASARYCERALELDDGLHEVHTLLTSLFLHGETYTQVLGRIHRHLRPRTYVEI